jgi:hypothetical protein
MNLTIIPSDDAVYVNGVVKTRLNLHQFSIPIDIHALQWHETKGWLEFKHDIDDSLSKIPNDIIFELPKWALDSYQAWVDAPLPKQIFVT